MNQFVQSLLFRHEDGGRCKHSDVPEMYNQCQQAHSREELDEWRERWEWRQMKRDIAKAQHLYSYMQQLREDYENTDSGINVVSSIKDLMVFHVFLDLPFLILIFINSGSGLCLILEFEIIRAC
jgi:hypothetical protein